MCHVRPNSGDQDTVQSCLVQLLHLWQAMIPPEQQITTCSSADSLQLSSLFYTLKCSPQKSSLLSTYIFQNRTRTSRTRPLSKIRQNFIRFGEKKIEKKIWPKVRHCLTQSLRNSRRPGSYQIILQEGFIACSIYIMLYLREKILSIRFSQGSHSK